MFSLPHMIINKINIISNSFNNSRSQASWNFPVLEGTNVDRGKIAKSPRQGPATRSGWHKYMSVFIGVRITCEKSLFPLVCFNNIKSERFIYILRGFVIKQLLQSPLFDTSLLSTISVRLGNDGLCFHDLTYQLRFFCYP